MNILRLLEHQSRVIALMLVVIGVSSAAHPGLASDGVIRVTSTDMSASADGVCSLIEALGAAQTEVVPNVQAVTDCGRGNIIELRSGTTYRLTEPATLDDRVSAAFDDVGLPLIVSQIIIRTDADAPAVIMRESEARFRLFQVAPTGDLQLENLILRGGSAGRYSWFDYTNCRDPLCFLRGAGGAILNLHGRVTLDRVTLTTNTAPTNGGAVYSQRGMLKIARSRLTFNRAETFDGGAVAYTAFDLLAEGYFSGLGAAFNSLTDATRSHPAVFHLTAAVIADNQAASNGGGVFVSFNGDAQVSFDATTIASNRAGATGGGCAIWGTRLSDDSQTSAPLVRITASVIRDNINPAESTFAPLLGELRGGGGGIFIWGGELYLADTTVDGNRTTHDGGGIAAVGALVTLVDTVLTANDAEQGGGVFLSRDSFLDNASHLIVTDSRIQANTARQRGGGIAVIDESGHYEIDARSQVTENAAPDGADVWESVPPGTVRLLAVNYPPSRSARR